VHAHRIARRDGIVAFDGVENLRVMLDGCLLADAADEEGGACSEI
jgi:hypothetical protein